MVITTGMLGRMAATQYNQVADQLRQDILLGHYAPGVKLPAERDMCSHYDVSRITIRQALALLEDEQLVIRRQGSGTYVCQNPTRRIPLMIDYTGSVRDHAPTLRREVLLSRTLPAPEWVADELHISQGTDIFHAERVDRLDATAVAWDEVYIRQDHADALNFEDLARVDFLEAWSDAQRFRPCACRQRVEAVRASQRDRRTLGLATGGPLLKTVEIYDAARGKPAGLFVSHYHPEHITITSRFDYGGHQS
jgi:DNA-binding GntR family transcriptional regulator